MNNRDQNRIIFKNTAILSVSRMISSIIPAVVVIIIGRYLGETGVGFIFGVLSLVLLIYPFTDFGYSQILIREISRDRNKAKYMIGRALGFTILSSFFFFFFTLGISKFIKNFPFSYVFILSVSYLLIHSITRIWGSSFQAIDRLDLLATMEITDIGVRFAGILILVFLHRISVINVIYLYLISSTVLLIFVFAIGTHIFGFVPIRLQLISRREIVESSYFSLNFLGTSIFFQLDKVLLSRFSSIKSVGIYTFAQKVFSLFINILGALLMTTYPWFFRLGKNRKGREYLIFSMKIIGYVFAFGIFAGSSVYFTAPFIVKLMGSSFNDSILALRILSPYPLLWGITQVLGNVLTGADYQKERMQIIWVGAIMDIILDVILIIKYSWIGAAVATMLSYLIVILLQAGFMWSKGIFLERRENEKNG